MRKNISFKVFCLSLILFLSACGFNESEDLDPSLARLSDPLSPEEEFQSQVHSAGQAHYAPYTEEEMADLKGEKPFVLFFHADWCPLCRNLETQIINDLENLGAAVLLKVDYDSALDLRREYGVTAQSTLLFFDPEGEMVHKRINPPFALIQAFFAQTF